MSTTKNTDFQQFSDAAEYHNRRTTDRDPPPDCEREGCPSVFVLERRVDRHRDEINELKALMSKATEDTAEILEIVTTAKSFFKVLGWIGDKLKTIMAIVGVVSAAILWIKQGPKL